MAGYRNDEDGLRRRVSELERENETLQSSLDDVDVALLRSENARLERELRSRGKRDRTLEVQAGKDHIARVFGAIALGVGATFLVALIYVALEPGPMPLRFSLCLVAGAIAPSAWGLLRLVRGAEREQ